MTPVISSSTLASQLATIHISQSGNRFHIFLRLNNKAWCADVSSQTHMDNTQYIWINFYDCEDEHLGSMELDIPFVPYSLSSFNISEYKNKDELHIFINDSYDYEASTEICTIYYNKDQ